MSSRNLNGRIDGGAFASCFADEEVAACDELPAPLRALIKGSFVNTRATTVLAQWRDLQRQGVPLEAYVDWYAELLAVNKAKACRATYGDTHPQSGLIPGRSSQRAPDASHRYAEGGAGAAVSPSAERAARRAAEIDLSSV